MAENIAEILRKRQMSNMLRDDVLSRLSQREQSYYILQENFKNRQLLGEHAGSGGTETKQIEKTLSDIMKQARGGDLKDLRIASKRLEQVQKVVNKDTMQPEQYERLYGHIAEMQQVITEDLEKKNSLFTRAKRIVSENAVDVGAILVGMTGGDPVAALAVKFIGDKIRARRERKKQERAETARSLNADAEAIRPDMTVLPKKENIKSPDTGPTAIPPGDGLTPRGEQLVRLIEDISLFTEEISTDLKNLVRLATEAEERAQGERLRRLESDLESNFKKGPFGVMQGADPAQGGKAQTKSILSRIMQFVGAPMAAMGGFLGAMATNPVAWLAGGIIWAAVDGIRGLFKAQDWGVSSIAGFLGGLLGGTLNNSILNVFGNMGKWALIGATAGSVLPGVGTILGGLFGAALGGILGYFGGETIAKFIDDSVNFISEGINKGIDFISRIFRGIIDSVVSVFTAISDKIKSLVDDARAILGLGKAELDINDPNATPEARAYLKQIKDLGPDPLVEGQGMFESNESYVNRVKNYKIGQKGAKLAARNRKKREAKTGVKELPSDFGLLPKQQPKSGTQLTRIPSKVTSGTNIGDLGIDYDAYAATLGQRESGNNYQAVNTLGYLGKYQFGAMALEDVGLVKPGVGKKGLRALNNPSNWTIEGGKETFLNSPEIQEAAMKTLTTRNFKTLKRIGVLNENSSPDQIAGALATSHLLGPGGAKEVILKGVNKQDAYGTSGYSYYALGSATQGQQLAMVSKPSVEKKTTASTLSSSQRAADIAQVNSQTNVAVVPVPVNTPAVMAGSNSTGSGKTGLPMTSTGQPSVRQVMMG